MVHPTPWPEFSFNDSVSQYIHKLLHACLKPFAGFLGDLPLDRKPICCSIRKNKSNNQVSAGSAHNAPIRTYSTTLLKRFYTCCVGLRQVYELVDSKGCPDSLKPQQEDCSAFFHMIFPSREEVALIEGCLNALTPYLPQMAY